MRGVLNILGLLLAVAGVATLCAFFPRFLLVVEAGFRQLRYVWWLILIFILYLYLRSVFRRE